MRKPVTLFAAAVIGLAALPAQASAQFPACLLITAAIDAGDIADALYNTSQCTNQLRVAWVDGLLASVDKPLAGQAPSDGRVETAMGVSVLNINHGDTENSYTVGSGQAESAMSAVGELARLANAFGASTRSSSGPQTDQVEIARRVNATREMRTDGSCTITTATSDGVQVNEGPDCDIVLLVARAFFEAIDEYIANN